MIKQTSLHKLLYLVIFFAQISLAQEKAPWTDLSPQERQILQQLEPQWESLSAQRQQRLRRGANRFQQMQPAERSQARDQRQKFQNLSQQQQQIINQRFQRFNGLSRSDQRRLRNIQRRFQDMSQAERSRLREQFEQKLRPDNNRPNQDDAARDTQNQQRIRNAIRQNQGGLRHNRHQTPQVRPQTQQRPSATRPVPPAPR
jgi:hypothetical protein